MCDIAHIQSRGQGRQLGKGILGNKSTIKLGIAAEPWVVVVSSIFGALIPRRMVHSMVFQRLVSLESAFTGFG